MASDWEVDVQLLLDVTDDEWARLQEGMVDAMEKEPQYEIVPTATSNSPTGALFSVGATVQVSAATPGEATDTAVAVTRRALQSAGGSADRGVAEINVRRGGVDPRLLGR
ncbi:hypothetical protein ABT039_09725 [Streptomyces lasiicapitis]|uniref:hypothetical protein n=1 Tax=Streptomyces TaxID=1883 RepID=UPI0013DB75B6|nr:hypothetical protein [Streptomyces aureoverticillatus]QIB45581.1 hypothetical protein G3H79_23405 [Streptomyces aureoverticillatus]